VRSESDSESNSLPNATHFVVVREEVAEVRQLLKIGAQERGHAAPAQQELCGSDWKSRWDAICIEPATIGHEGAKFVPVHSALRFGGLGPLTRAMSRPIQLGYHRQRGIVKWRRDHKNGHPKKSRNQDGKSHCPRAAAAI